MVKILNELPSFCEDCPYISLRVCERLGSGALAYSCNHIGMCYRIYDIVKKREEQNVKPFNS